MTRIKVKQRPRDSVAILEGQSGKWAPGDTPNQAINALLMRYPELQMDLCHLCGEPMGEESASTDNDENLVHIACLRIRVDQER